MCDRACGTLNFDAGIDGNTVISVTTPRHDIFGNYNPIHDRFSVIIAIWNLLCRTVFYNSGKLNNLF